MPENSDTYVICHQDTPQDSISKNTLRAIFSMHLQEWQDGSAVKVFVLGDKNKIHQNFTKTHLGFFPYQLRRSWDRLVFSGTGEAPTKVESIEQMKRLVATTKGAIGYIASNQLEQNVKRLEVK
jgi:ABC-type phosphate transport system substrate-binding protein